MLSIMLPGRVQLLLLLAAQGVCAIADPGVRGLRGLTEVQNKSSHANMSVVNVSIVPFSHLTGDILTGGNQDALTLDNVDVYNGLRALVIKVVGLIPEVGKAIAALVDFFWPKQQKSVWDQIKDKVQAMVNGAMLKLELQQRQADLDAYQTTLGRYAMAKDKERKGFLSDLITEGDNIYAKLTTSLVKEQILPITVAFSLLHVGVLAERYEHGKLIIGEDNSVQWLKELKDLHQQYSIFFVEQYDAWHKFRFAQIEISTPKIERPTAVPPFFYWCATGRAHDKLTGSEINFEQSWTDSDDLFQNAVESIREMWMNRAVADMAAAMSPFFLSHRMIPLRENEGPQVLPKLQVIWMGPYSVTTVGLLDGSQQSAAWSTADIIDKPGQVKSWLVREYNSVDYQQLKFTSHDGKGVGNPNGGAPHEVSPPQGHHFIGSTMLWAKGLLASIDLQFSDGTSSGNLGNRGGWGGSRINDIVSGGLYQLDAGAYATGSGPSNTQGTGILKHRFSIPNASWNGTLSSAWKQTLPGNGTNANAGTTEGIATSHSQVAARVVVLLALILLQIPAALW